MIHHLPTILVLALIAPPLVRLIGNLLRELVRAGERLRDQLAATDIGE